MKKKIIVLICIISIIGTIYYIYTLYTDTGNSISPTSYLNITQLEKDLDIEVYNLYDIEEYIDNDEKVLLQKSLKSFSVSGKNMGNNKIFYMIESGNDVQYSMNINIPTLDNFENCKKMNIKNGILYQYHYIEETGIVFVGAFVKDHLNCTISIKNKSKDDTEMIEEKFIEYFKDIESIQSHSYD